MSLGDELRNARQVAGLTQEQVSVGAGIDRAYLSLLENDRKSPTVDVLLRVCRALGVKASDLFVRLEAADGDPQPRPEAGTVRPPGRGRKPDRRRST